jgi:AraC-like DNA-binding protein
MDSLGRGPLYGICDDKNVEKCNLQAVKRNVPPNQNLPETRLKLNASTAVHNGDGFIYEKCKFCGSIIVRMLDDSSATGDPETPYADSPANALEAECALPSNEGAVQYKTSSQEAYDADGYSNGARAYGLSLTESGCSGICIQYDTRSCGGNRCKSCEVSAAGLCCKRYLLNRKNSNILERDGGDYRNLMGVFLRRYKRDSMFDEQIRQKLSVEASRANEYRDEMRRHINGADNAHLVFEWREYTLDDLLVMFPHVAWRPVRIEIQLLIYLFYNYRYPIDLEHVETRFLLPKRAINRYLRAYFSYSYSSLLAKIRNEHSKLLLRIPLLRIGEIGTLVGYKSHYHYSLSFKRYEGISPKEYRQNTVDNSSDD